MIYRPDIEKKCALCLYAKKMEEEMFFCEKKKKFVKLDEMGCKKFDYDIFKKTVRRRPSLASNVSAEDFEL